MAIRRVVWHLAIAAAVLGATTLTLTAAPEPQQGPTIEITLTGNTVRVSQGRVTVQRGQMVTWTSDVPFAIVVDRHSSLFPNLPPQALAGRANAPAQARVGGNTPAGTYKYSVVVWDGEEMRVLDPEIVIPPG